ncbi:MAG: DNA cytosine methyltransferase [Rhodovibrionaceae bacterium]
MNRPIGIDLFSGAGGLSLGFEQAGFDVVAAVEIDPVHAAVHAFNFPKCAVIPKSVVGLTGAEIRDRANLGSRQIDVVFGGAPCQGFSLIGQRALDDPRNALVKDFVRIVSELDAAYFVFENVKGLTVGKHRKFLEELIEEFESFGYDVQKQWQVLNASSFGVPQDRERLILMGTKNGRPIPKYPERVTIAASRSNGGLPAGPSCFDALGDLPEAESFLELSETDEVTTDTWGPPSEYARELRCLDNDAWHYGYIRAWKPRLLTSSRRTVHTDISRRRFAETQPGTVEPISRFFKLPVNGVSNTLRAGTDAARGAFTSPRPIHYERPRCITVREMARLHGFPDWFRLHSTKWHGARQIGNAVPPPLARAVGSQILAALGRNPVFPNETLKLGDVSLLRMDLSEAAEFWGISNPIGRRNKKSGAKKRRQTEIESERLAG